MYVGARACPLPLHPGPPLPPPCALPPGVEVFTDVELAAKDVDIAVMVGGYPRKLGEERKDVMSKNVKIYKSQASALSKHAAKDVKVGGSLGRLLQPTSPYFRQLLVCKMCSIGQNRSSIMPGRAHSFSRVPARVAAAHRRQV